MVDPTQVAWALLHSITCLLHAAYTMPPIPT